MPFGEVIPDAGSLLRFGESWARCAIHPEPRGGRVEAEGADLYVLERGGSPKGQRSLGAFAGVLFMGLNGHRREGGGARLTVSVLLHRRRCSIIGCMSCAERILVSCHSGTL